MEPKFDLEWVRRLIKDVDLGDHYFCYERALCPVVENLQLTPREAKVFILEQISELDKENFSERVLIVREVYDVYGKIIRNIPWYIKFRIDEVKNGKYVFIFSFHPTEKVLITQSETLQP